MAGVIPAIILAAGKSTRMGRLKAALPVSDTETFLTQLVRTFHAAGVENVTVVLGYEAGRLRTDLSRVGLAPRLVVNDRFEAGQLSSLLAGLEAVDGPQVQAILMMLVDAPLVSAETVRAVLERYEATRAPIVRPVRGTEHGHPVLIDRSLFGALRAASPASGAKPIVRPTSPPRATSRSTMPAPSWTSIRRRTTRRSAVRLARVEAASTLSRTRWCRRHRTCQ